MIIEARSGREIIIGRIGENEARKIAFHVGNILRDFPEAGFSLVHQRPGDPAAYPVNSSYMEQDGNYLYWTVQSGDLTEEGVGSCELIATKGDAIVKTEIFRTKILNALDDSEDPPEPWESWVQDVEDAADRAETAAENAESIVLVQDTQPEAEGNKIWMMETPPDSVVVPTYEEHQTKADKVSGATNGNFAGLDSNGNLTDSGHKHSDYLTSHQDISGKADKVSGAVSGNFAGLDGNGNLVDSGHKHSDYLTSHQDISGKADKVSGATSGHFAGLDSNGNLTDSGSKASDFLTAHQDISGKADKVASATNGNFAALDSNGNLTDSGHKHSDYLTQHQDISGKLDKTDFYATEMPMSSGDSTKVSAEVQGLKSAIDELPSDMETNASNVDLDITDNNGNVIARFANGNIQTKNFDSGETQKDKLTNASGVDLDITDNNGNVILRMYGGNVKTKNFDSSEMGRASLLETTDKTTFVNAINEINEIANADLPLKGKVIVNFGDSIFGNKRPPNDISTELAKETGATVYNCGFGGCRMSQHDYSRRNTWGQFSMFELADAIATNTWDGQDAAVENSSWTDMPSYFPDTLELLESIDFSNVDIVTIAYGTNDFTAGVPLDDNSDLKSTSTFAGALRYSIETLLTAFPNIRIICCGQCYRWWDNSGEFVDDSNTHEVNGQKLTQFVSKTGDVASEYNLQFIDNYSIGIGKFTRSYFFTGSDTTHPNNIGTKLIAEHIANELY